LERRALRAAAGEDYLTEEELFELIQTDAQSGSAASDPQG
jgi:hypothetical protein